MCLYPKSIVVVVVYELAERVVWDWTCGSGSCCVEPVRGAVVVDRVTEVCYSSVC